MAPNKRNPDSVLLHDISIREDDLSSLMRDLKALIELKIETYLQKKEVSANIDKLLGSRAFVIESELVRSMGGGSPDYKTWIGFDSQAFQTTYHEFYEILLALKMSPKQRVLDIGSAYGRMGIVKQVFFPEIQFIGCELVAERLHESIRLNNLLGGSNVQFIEQDIIGSDTDLPSAEYYFIYDFSDRDDFSKLIDKFRIKSKSQPIRVIARGRGVNNWIFELAPWLTVIVPPEPHNTWTIYRNCP